MLKIKYCLPILALILLAAIKNAQASCAFSSAATAQIFTIPLDNRTFSIPPNTLPGQIIARQYITAPLSSSMPDVVCSTGPMYKFYQYKTLPLGLATNYTDVYQTNVAGIGVRYYASRVNYPSFPYNYQYSTGNRFPIANYTLNFFIEFIKTAKTVSPGQVLASSLPITELAAGQEANKVVYARMTMSGQFTVTTPTCNIAPASASMTVQMGTHMANSFSGIGSGNDWKNASIRLIDCPQFYGNGYSGLTSQTATNNTTPTQYALTANTWSLSLTPRNGVIDAANGIMKIDDETGKATGVGIQLSTSESVSGKINLTNGVKKSITQDGSTTITIPLYARYIQTESTIGAGKANGRLEYTITYQ